MKLSRSDVKALVKECLIEILNEGLGGAVVPQNNRAKMSGGLPKEQFSENTRKQPQQKERPSKQLLEAVKLAACGNNIMESILADTAASTLPKMMDKDGMKNAHAGFVEQVVAEANPEDLFGEDASARWANLAFMDSPTTK